MSIYDDIELLVEAKRVLKFQIGNDHLAAAIARTELRLRGGMGQLEKLGLTNLPYDTPMRIMADFTLTADGLKVHALQVVGLPPQPRPRLELVASNNTPPYVCKFCGAGSWKDPSEQERPADYCHPEDHGHPRGDGQ